MYPFTCCLGYQPPIFPEEEKEVGVAAAQALVKRAQAVWKKARLVLLKNVSDMKRFSDRHRRPAPVIFAILNACSDLNYHRHSPIHILPV